MNLKELVDKYCPNGVKSINIDEICKIETGKLNANSAVKNGKYAFFTTSKIPSKIDKYNWDKEALLISGNADVGSVKYYKGKFNAYQRVYVLSNFEKEISVKYVYFVLTNNLKQYLSNNKNKSAMTYILLNSLKKFKIPVPPLPVQEEIVRILDKFTNLTNEFKNELDLRKKQYEYYRDKLLSFDGGGVKWKRLGDIGCFYGGLVGKSKSDFNKGNAKFITYKNVYSNMSVDTNVSDTVRIKDCENQHALHFGDICFTGSSETPCECGLSSVLTKFPKEPLYLNSFCFFFRLKNLSEINVYYLKYLFRSDEIRKKIIKTANGVTRFNISKELMKNLLIPIPPLSVQKEIVEKLDRFNELCNEVTKGLPAEIQMREKQYEYYRDKLLSFKGTQ